MHDNDVGILDDRGEVLDWTVGDLPEAPDQGRDAYRVPLVSCNDTSQGGLSPIRKKDFHDLIHARIERRYLEGFLQRRRGTRILTP
jgi:hypothetical protein